MIDGVDLDGDMLEFFDLESRYGHENAYAILRMLEQFEGVTESRVKKLSCDERLKNVFRMMSDNLRYQTRH